MGIRYKIIHMIYYTKMLKLLIIIIKNLEKLILIFTYKHWFKSKNVDLRF